MRQKKKSNFFPQTATFFLVNFRHYFNKSWMWLNYSCGLLHILCPHRTFIWPPYSLQHVRLCSFTLFLVFVFFSVCLLIPSRFIFCSYLPAILPVSLIMRQVCLWMHHVIPESVLRRNPPSNYSFSNTRNMINSSHLQNSLKFFGKVPLPAFIH